MLEGLASDLRLALRRLVRQPGLALVAILTLGIGFGANTAVFSFVNALFLRPLPVSEPGRLVRLSALSAPDQFEVLSWPNVDDVGRQTRTLQALAAHQRVAVSYGSSDEALNGELVSGRYFDVLGLTPALGRLLQASDVEPVVVVSERFWRDRLGADPQAPGRSITLNGTPFSIVGVVPASFRGSYDAFAAEFWAPLGQHEALRPRGLPLDRRGWGWLSATGRLQPGVGLGAARSEIAALGEQLAHAYPNENEGLRLTLTPASALPEGMQQAVSRALGVLMAVVGLVLVAACTNVASALLVRVLGRRREMAVRQALGAGRSRLVRLWLAEGLLIAALGGVAGVVFAAWMADSLLALRPALSAFADFGPRLDFDGRVWLFWLLSMLLTGLALGAIPALRAARPDVDTALRQESTTSASPSRWLSVFVIAQIAVSAALVLTAGLLLRSVAASRAFDVGFQTENLVVAGLNLSHPSIGAERGQALSFAALERVRVLPGVAAATLGRVVPLSDSREQLGVKIAGYQPPEGKAMVLVNADIVGPAYFATLGIPILRGRDFAASDMSPSAAPVAVINETMARRFWPQRDALGGRITVDEALPPVEVVGVARDIQYYSLGEAPRAYLYLAYGRFHSDGMAVLARTRGPASASVTGLRQALVAEAGARGFAGAGTFEELREIPLFPSRLLGTVTTAFGAVALLLSSVGLYGLVAHRVSQKTREIGIRMALGAAPRQILAAVLRQGMLLALVGVVVGVAAATLLTRSLTPLLFGVTSHDPAAFLPLGALLLVALVACLLPARRATRLDPVAALRQD